ncbi:hypothetical protein PAAG_11070 [Paracoccidioides lutzii Pb01]|uniref:Uncharacterized protein n=1 Tax=Paracoccidioides lutzii (strain ATCC MYA-826 / Pb01) TaxID=502779 RepID=A0A0A2VMQ9_PARBA|nr:hypothetical protein PAAG_11070 [Paracoccidioides lutzii Pb01]KGQ02119.1 hypothetical protein PAAG_11070 [Paracoccidioides lutzii Pb01]
MSMSLKPGLTRLRYPMARNRPEHLKSLEMTPGHLSRLIAVEAITNNEPWGPWATDREVEVLQFPFFVEAQSI